jgi:CHAT domain-containing protein
LEEADTFFTLRREESTFSSDFEGLVDRERATLLENSWRLPQIAVQLLNSGKEQPDNDIREQVWKWVQRSKARSLAMTTGVGGIIPSTLLHQFMLSETCRPLYERMILLQKKIQAAPLQERFALRQELDLHKLSMRKEVLLRESIDLKDGKPLNSSDIDRISVMTNTPFVLVDWFHIPGVLDDGEFLLLTKRSRSAATVSALGTTPQQVEKWVDLYLDRPSSKLRAKLTSDISGLVQPLTDLTQPGEIMIFCPTALLHRIPLHAIEVITDESLGWEPLIYRNPVLFIHSHSLLRVCHWNSQSSAEVMEPLSPLLMNGIPDKEGNEAFGHGRDSVKMLAAQLGAKAWLNEQATKSTFVEHAPNSRLIHVHSHVYWDAADPRAHHISFSDSDTVGESGKLTTYEVFALPLSKGCHVSLVACSGGRARVGSGDEVMGLIPALLHSGASSTISTLCNIPDQIGANFTGAFYRSFLEERKTVPVGGFVNIARIFQSAVLELDKDENDTVLHWTSFILHGFWFFFVPVKDAMPLA